MRVTQMPGRLGFAYSVPTTTTSTLGTRPVPFGVNRLLLSTSQISVHVAIGPNPTAVAGTSMLVPPNFPFYVGVVPGDQVAIVGAAAGNPVFVAEIGD